MAFADAPNMKETGSSSAVQGKACLAPTRADNGTAAQNGGVLANRKGPEVDSGLRYAYSGSSTVKTVKGSSLVS